MERTTRKRRRKSSFLRLFLLFVTLFVLLVFSGCSVLELQENQELLQAPMLNLEQKAVYDALETTLDMSSITYKNPRGGQYRTSFVFFDLDGDDVKEAVVFYSEKQGRNEIFAKVLKQDQDGSWYTLQDLPGHGDQVAFVDFVPMLEKHYYCLVIGWQDSKDPGKNYMGVYPMYEQAGSVSFHQDILEPYDEYVLEDFNQDGLYELVLVRKNRNELYEVALFQERTGLLSQTDSITLNPETFTILQTISGKLWNGNLGIYIDERIQEQASSGAYYATEVIEVVDDSLELVAGFQAPPDSQALSNYLQTFRLDSMLSVDLWDDGVVYIPQAETLPGLQDSDDQKIVKLTEYRRLTNDGLETLYNAIVNAEDGYLVLLPERWLGQIIVEQRPENHEWRIHKLNLETGQPSTELFRITVRSQWEELDPSSNDDIKLAEKGSFTYYGYIPETRDEPLAITSEEAEKIFALFSN